MSPASGKLYEFAVTKLWYKPAAKANSPLIGGMPTRQAVANCSGMAIAASVNAAMLSPGIQEASKPRREANSQPARLAGLTMLPVDLSCPSDLTVLGLLLLLLHFGGVVFAANVRDIDLRGRQR